MILCIKTIFFITSLIIGLYYLGIFLSKMIGIIDGDNSTFIVYGFIFLLSLFEVVSFPFLILKKYFGILYIIFLMLVISTVVLSVYSDMTCKKLEENIIRKSYGDRKNIWKYLFIFLLVVQVFVTSYFHYDSDDDGYYIAISNAAIEQDIIEFNDTVAYSGNYFFEDSCTRPGIQSWELLVAVFSKLYKIHPAIMTHTILPILLVTIYYMAAKEVFKKIAKNDVELYVCMCIYSLINIFYGNGYLFSSYLAVGAFTGKAILFKLVIPLILSVCIDIYREDVSENVWYKLSYLSLAGVAATATGIYIVPIYCLVLGMPYIINLMYLKKYSYLILILKKCILSISGLIIIGLYAIIQMAGLENIWADKYYFNWNAVSNLIFGGNKIIVVLFIGALLSLLKFEREKGIITLFTGSTTIILLIFWNPLIANFLAVNVTGVPVYWRMALLLPVTFIIPISLTYAIRMPNRKYIAAIGIAIGMIMVNGIGMNRNMLNFYSAHQNWYMIPQNVLEICEKFDLSKEEKIVILADQNINKFFRQYSSWFDVVVGRSDQIRMNELGEAYFEMYEGIFKNRTINAQTLNQLEMFGVEYIISQEKLNVLNEYKIYDRTNEFLIYKKNDNN